MADLRLSRTEAKIGCGLVPPLNSRVNAGAKVRTRCGLIPFKDLAPVVALLPNLRRPIHQPHPEMASKTMSSEVERMERFASNNTTQGFYEDILGDFGFRVVWTTDGGVSANVDVYEIVGREENNAPMLGDVCDGIHDEPDTYLTGFLKWDACCHLYFGEPDNKGYIHICGPESFRKHVALIEYLLERAPKVIPSADDIMWEVT